MTACLAFSRLPGVDLRFEPDRQLIDLIESWPADIDDTSARRDWNWQPQFDLPRLADHFIRDLQS